MSFFISYWFGFLEYDGYDDVYGHSVEDDSCISPSDGKLINKVVYLIGEKLYWLTYLPVSCLVA